MNFKTLELLSTTSISIMAFLLSETFSGYFKAWAAYKTGDDFSFKMGYLSWNPFKHLDILGAFLFIGTNFRIGWTSMTPVRLSAIVGPLVWFKRAAAMLSDAFINLVLATLSLTLSQLIIRIYGAGHPISTVSAAGFSISYKTFTEIFYFLPSSAVVWTFFLITLVKVNVLLCALKGVVDMVLLLFHAVLEKKKAVVNPLVIFSVQLITVLVLFRYGFGPSLVFSIVIFLSNGLRAIL